MVQRASDQLGNICEDKKFQAPLILRQIYGKEIRTLHDTLLHLGSLAGRFLHPLMPATDPLVLGTTPAHGCHLKPSFSKVPGGDQEMFFGI
jgi:hypothetical protein